MGGITLSKYDAIVVGGGPGGSDCAIRLSQRGKKVAIVERKEFGGTCTNVGCIPTKALLTVAKLYSDVKEKGKRFGVLAQVDIDLKTVMKHMNRSILMSRKGTETLLRKYGVEIIKDNVVYKNGSFYLENADEILDAEKIVLATGSKPKIPKALAVEGIWTSNEVFSMPEFPESILIIGAGYIGVEMATIFNAFGTKVTLVELQSRVIPFEDVDASTVLEKSLKKRGVKVKTGVAVEKVQKLDNGFLTNLSDGEQLETEKVLVAIGRAPVYPKGLEETELVENGKITTNEDFETKWPNVYAIGDVRGAIMLAHVASAEGIALAEKLSGNDYTYYSETVPAVIFCEPEIASTGIKETEDGLSDEYDKFLFPMSANPRANILAERDGFVKLIANKNDHKIAGITIVGPNAVELLMEGVVVINEQLTVEELLKSIHPHPTLSEIIRDAAEGLEGNSIHI